MCASALLSRWQHPAVRMSIRERGRGCGGLLCLCHLLHFCLWILAPVNQIECHQNVTSYDADFNITSQLSSSASSSSSPWLPHQQQTQLVFVESESSIVVCSVRGGYPPPSISLYVGPLDITALFDEPIRLVQVSGVRGLRQVVYQTEVATDRLVLKYSHSQFEFRCDVTVPGLPARSLYIPILVQCKHLQLQETPYFSNNAFIF